MTMGFILSKFCPQLSAGNQLCCYLGPCKITHTEAHLSGKRNPRQWISNLILVFPSVAFQISISNPSNYHGSNKQEKEFRIHRPHPIPQVNDLRTTWSRLNLHFTSKKGNVHTWGGSGVNNNYLKPGFYHFCLQLPTVFESAWLLPADAQLLALWTGLWIKETFSKLRPKWK